jgi:hypothetical protein
MLETQTFDSYFNRLLQSVKVLPTSVVTNEIRESVRVNQDVSIWLGKVGYASRHGYLTLLCFFLKCVNIENPTELLDLKTYENVRQRFFPAERLVEYWQSLLRQKGVPAHLEKRVLTAVRSFFKYNRVPLLQITCSYRAKEKPSISDDDLCKFREALDWRDTILFDFLVSVPLRRGQFQICPNCKRDFFPKWKHILTFPDIQPYSPFVIKPEKGHESENYPEGFMQICFLTGTAAKGLNIYRAFKESELDKSMKPDDYIFTHKQNFVVRHNARKHITPIGKTQVWQIFKAAQEKTGLRVYPHYLRSWDNVRLAACGIDKQLRDIYLGHATVVSEEEGYILQMIPKWQETFKKARAIESLDLVQGIISPMELQTKLMQLEDQQTEIARLRAELGRFNMTEEDIDNLRWLLEKVKRGKVVVKE